MNENFYRYIYGGRLPLEEYDLLDIIKFLEAAQEFNLQELTIHIQSFLVENKAKWIEQNFVLVYQTSFKHDSLLELQKLCTDIITNEPEKFFESVDFTSIPEKSLISIIQMMIFR